MKIKLLLALATIPAGVLLGFGAYKVGYQQPLPNQVTAIRPAAAKAETLTPESPSAITDAAKAAASVDQPIEDKSASPPPPPPPPPAPASDSIKDKVVKRLQPVRKPQPKPKPCGCGTSGKYHVMCPLSADAAERYVCKHYQD